MAFNTIKRPSVVEEIIDSFKEKLINGELKPGDKLPSEMQLMEQLGVGRTALREAVKMLSALGVIDVKQGDGSYIMQGSSSAVMSPLVFAILLESGMTREMLELRVLVQTGYCLLASEKATVDDIELIEESQKVFEEKIKKSDRDVNDLAKADLDFHYAILNASHNLMVTKIGGAVEELFFGSIRNTISQIEGRFWGVEGHRNILSAIKAKDPMRVINAVRISLERWSKDLDE